MRRFGKWISLMVAVVVVAALPAGAQQPMILFGSGGTGTGVSQPVPITTLINSGNLMTGYFSLNPTGFTPQYLPVLTFVSDGNPLSGYFLRAPLPQTLTVGNTIYPAGSAVPQSVVVPEPSSLALLLGVGVAGSALFLRRRREGRAR